VAVVLLVVLALVKLVGGRTHHTAAPAPVRPLPAATFVIATVAPTTTAPVAVTDVRSCTASETTISAGHEPDSTRGDAIWIELHNASSTPCWVVNDPDLTALDSDRSALAWQLRQDLSGAGPHAQFFVPAGGIAQLTLTNETPCSDTSVVATAIQVNLAGGDSLTQTTAALEVGCGPIDQTRLMHRSQPMQSS
jgi:hypothetical protein